MRIRIEDLIVTNGQISPKKVFSWAVLAIFVLVVLVNLGSLFERNNSGIYQVKQSYWDGTLSTRFAPGLYYQGLADLTNFKAATSYKFTDKEDAKNISGPPIIVRFNDGGRAKIYGDARFVLPRNDQDMANIKLIFDDQETLEKELYSQIVKEAVVMTAALMSAEESYSSLRSQFSEWADDQVTSGVFIVEKKTRMVPDENNIKKKIKEEYVDIKRDPETNEPVRKEAVLSGFNIALQQFIVEDIVYLDGLDSLINKKREFLTEIIKVKSEGEKAVQERKTAISEGDRLIAEARYKKLQDREKIVLEYEKRKEQMLIDANKTLTVAKENRMAALNHKQELIAKGRGEAEARRLALQADGALGMKKKFLEEAFSAYKVAFVKANLAPPYVSVDYFQSKSGQDLPPGVNTLSQVYDHLAEELGIKLTF